MPVLCVVMYSLLLHVRAHEPTVASAIRVASGRIFERPLRCELSLVECLPAGLPAWYMYKGAGHCACQYIRTLLHGI